MSNDNIIPLSNPAFHDQLTDLVRAGAQEIIRKAVREELDEFLNEHDDRDENGRRAVVRNGYLPEREVLTGVGEVTVQVPRTRDRSGAGRAFRSELLPPYLKRTNSLEATLPWLYLVGVSTNDFDQALRALFGDSVQGLSANTISRLKKGWEEECAEWRRKDWSDREFVYLWADGIHVNVRSDDRRCVLVVIGCDAQGSKHFLAIEQDHRESTESWKAVLSSLRDRGINTAKLAVGDGALGLQTSLPT